MRAESAPPNFGVERGAAEAGGLAEVGDREEEARCVCHGEKLVLDLATVLRTRNSPALRGFGIIFLDV